MFPKNLKSHVATRKIQLVILSVLENLVEPFSIVQYWSS